MTRAITVNIFPGGFNWAIYVAQHKGLFTRSGISVTVQETANSMAQMTALSTGACDIAMTGIDNVVAYVEGQGEAPIGPQPEFFAFMGSDTAFLNLIAASDIGSIGALKGKSLSVDALTTGFAFVLFDILRRNGLSPDHYTVVKFGGTAQRWQALREGRHDATLLSTPYNILAQTAGFTQLARGVDVLGRYQGNVGAARRSWASANKDAVIGFIRGYADAVDWLYDRTNHAEAIQILCQELPDMTAELAMQAYGELLDPKDGFFRNGRIDIEGVRTVLELRRRYAKPAKHLSDPAKYLDEAYLRAAIG
jgi:ABC-type nitrate/sulfonate/bicarbonate transport system substrate-binding protein